MLIYYVTYHFDLLPPDMYIFEVGIIAALCYILTYLFSKAKAVFNLTVATGSVVVFVTMLLLANFGIYNNVQYYNFIQLILFYCCIGNTACSYYEKFNQPIYSIANVIKTVLMSVVCPYIAAICISAQKLDVIQLLGPLFFIGIQIFVVSNFIELKRLYFLMIPIIYPVVAVMGYNVAASYGLSNHFSGSGFVPIDMSLLCPVIFFMLIFIIIPLEAVKILIVTRIEYRDKIEKDKEQADIEIYCNQSAE